jgi:hypothetical protein
MIAQVGYSVAGRSRGQVALCAVCTVHVETRSAGFLVEPQNQDRWFVSDLASKQLGRFLTVCQWFGLKTTGTVSSGSASKLAATVFSGLASKPVVTVFSGLVSKPAVMVFSSLTSKLVATVSLGLASKSAVGFLFEPQNQGGGGFPGLGLKTGSFSLMIWALKSPRQFLGLGLKTSGLRFVGCATKSMEGGWRRTRV